MDKGILVCLAGRIKGSLRVLVIYLKGEQRLPCVFLQPRSAVQEQMWNRLKIGFHQHWDFPKGVW